MSGKKTKTGRSQTPGSVPDQDLWDRYTRTVRPANKRKDSQAGEPAPTREMFGALLDSDKAPRRPGNRSSPGSVNPVQVPVAPKTQPIQQRAPKSTTSPSSVDPHILRRVRRGGGFDARIDLHGMRRDEAYHALLGFLADCHHRRLKLVLVITGKGSRSKQAQDWWDMPERGVLKRLVPQWLSRPAFSRLVAGYGSAGRADGGEGALYIQIRSPRRTSGPSS
ncbi:MAG: Smr/MutS family protein [Pseudomonadota bacterium]